MSDKGTETLSAGTTVQVVSGHSNGGDAGQTYQYIGPDGASIDLGKEDYTNTLKWQPVDLGLNAFMGFIRILTTYLNSDSGAGNNLYSSFTQATAMGQKTMSLAGAVTYLQLTHNSNATIEAGAKINQDPSDRRAAARYTTGSGTVQVAEGDTVLVQTGQTPGTTSAASTSTPAPIARRSTSPRSTSPTRPNGRW